MKIIIFSTLLSCAVAAPGLYLEQDADLIQDVPAKSTFTSSSQIVDHGTTFVHAPVFKAVHTPVHVNVPLSAKTTVTKSSQVVNHGGTAVLHAEVPVYHAAEVHVPLEKTITKNDQIVDYVNTYIHTPVVPVVSSAKTTVTKSSQLVNHGGTEVLYTAFPVHSVSHAIPLNSIEFNQVVDHGSIHSLPVSHSSVTKECGTYFHEPFAWEPVHVHTPLISLKTGDSAVSHQSSTVHKTVPVLKSLYTLHH